jgi:hypothetical protein
MLKNYLKSGLRSLAKNKLSSAINILGLALAVGCCLVVFQFLDFSMHFDNFNRACYGWVSFDPDCFGQSGG